MNALKLGFLNDKTIYNIRNKPWDFCASKIKTDLIRYEHILIPFLYNNHWMLFDYKDNVLTIYNSLNLNQDISKISIVKAIKECLEAILQKTIIVKDALNIPQQQNSVDCGIMVLLYAKAISFNTPIPISNNYSLYRAVIIYELLRGAIIKI
ncbi:hypothetical protein NUSPORA_02811 [Nucleospora cyclopteri]